MKTQYVPVRHVPLGYYSAMTQVLPVLVVGHVLVSARYAGSAKETGLPAALAAFAVLGIVLGGVAEAVALWVLYFGRRPAEILEQFVVLAALLKFGALVLGASAAYGQRQRGL